MNVSLTEDYDRCAKWLWLTLGLEFGDTVGRGLTDPNPCVLVLSDLLVEVIGLGHYLFAAGRALALHSSFYQAFEISVISLLALPHCGDKGYFLQASLLLCCSASLY